MLSTPYALIALFYIYVAALVRPVHPGDDWTFFTEIADMILDGKGLYIFSARMSGGSMYPFSYPPAAALVLVPFQFLARLADLPPLFQSPLVSIPYLIGDIACAGYLVRLVRSYRPSLSDEWGYALFGGFLFSFACFFTTLWHGHQETTVAALLLAGLVSVREGKLTSAALWMCAAMAFKVTALMVAVPAFICIIVACGWKSGVRFGAVFWGAFAVFMAPWLIADPANTIYALKGFPAIQPYGSQSSWHIFGNAIYGPTLGIIKPHVNTAIAVIWLGYAAWMARRVRVTLDSPNLLAICAGCCIITALLQKAGSLHYVLPGMVVLAAWDSARNDSATPWLAILTVGVFSHIAIAHLLPGELSFNFATAWGQIVLFCVVLVCIHNQTKQNHSATKRGLVTAEPPSTITATVPPELVGAGMFPRDAG